MRSKPTRVPFQVEVALGGQRIDEMGQAQIGIDLFDTPLGAIRVVDDAHRALFDLYVVEHDVVTRRSAGGVGGDKAKRRFGSLVVLRANVALLVNAGRLLFEPHREHRTLHNHALGVDLAAEQLTETDIEGEPVASLRSAPAPILQIDDLDVGEHDMRARHGR